MKPSEGTEKSCKRSPRMKPATPRNGWMAKE